MCYCKPEIRTPYCPNCTSAMYQEIQRLNELLWGCRCIFCGEVVGRENKNQDIADDVLKAHIKVCPDHPVNKIRLGIEHILKFERSMSHENLIQALKTLLKES